MVKKQALVVGIDRYAEIQPLAHATHDAKEFAAILEMPEYGFEVRQLLDEQATDQAAQQAIGRLLRGEADIKVFYFAGHGFANNEEVYLVTVDATEDRLGLSLNWLGKEVRAAKGTVVLIFDCCHSGAGEIRAPSKYDCFAGGDIDRALGSLSKGKILMAACGPTEMAHESESVGHGVFTFYLLEGLMGKAANLQGVVTPMGLYEYVARTLEEEKLQTPVWKAELVGQVILGAGFPASIPLTPNETGVNPEVLAAIEREAQAHLDHYLQQTTLPYAQWKTEGFRKASQLLQPILRWFDRNVCEYPELASSQAFQEANGEARARLVQISAISEGTWTDEGRVAKYLGAGGFGAVWKVERSGDTPLAYKVYHPDQLQIKEKLARFERGYRAMNQLDHPHIVKVHKYTHCPVGFYMDFINGPNLKDFVGTLTDPSDIVFFLLKIGETLKHAHGRGVIHRDVKPENIVITYDTDRRAWIPYLTDFDLAWFSTATQVTKDAIGVIFYAAPEQLAKPFSRAAHLPTTDVYAFGKLCYFTATGSHPIPFGIADNKRALTERINDWKSAEAATTFLRLYDECTQQDPAGRPQDFRVICDRLFLTYSLLHELHREQEIDIERFTRELVYAVVGLPEEPQRLDNSFHSLSGQTMVSLQNIVNVSNNLELTVRFEHHLSLAGIGYEKARHLLNKRLEDAMARYGNVVVRAGTKGMYEVYLTLRNIERNLVGVDHCRRIITRAIDTVESE